MDSLSLRMCQFGNRPPNSVPNSHPNSRHESEECGLREFSSILILPVGRSCTPWTRWGRAARIPWPVSAFLKP